MDELSLITGGAGFIGSHLAEELVRRGQPVRVLDDFSTGLWTNLSHLDPTPELVEGSLTDPAAVAKAMHGVGIVYHLGALASVARSVENPPVSHAACATGTLHLLDAARKSGVRRVVYAASSSAYGGASGVATGQAEDLPMVAKSPYVAAKLAGELHAGLHTYGIETVRLRLFNIFRPRQRRQPLLRRDRALHRCEERWPPADHPGDGQQCTRFHFVGNAVQALTKAAERPWRSRAMSTNVGTGRTVNLLERSAA